MKHFQTILLIVMILTACGRSADKSFIQPAATMESAEEIISPEKSAVSADIMQKSEEAVPERKIIKEGWVRIKVKDYTTDLGVIKKIVERHSGYISNEYESSTDYSLNNSLTIRVPSTDFDVLVDDIIKVALKVDSKNITLKDVTEEFIDVEARLKTKKEVEERYLEILKKASTVQEILLVEEQLRIIREEIEAKEGRLKYLQNQVSLSTLNLEIYQELFFEPGFRFFKKIDNALRGGWKGFLSVVVGLVYIWPVLLIVGILVVWFFRRRKRKRILRDGGRKG